jgi:DUF2934 family protein
MKTNDHSATQYEEFAQGTGAPRTATGARAILTQDHEVIRRWAARRSAEPATGEATASGPATIDVHDGGAGIRFNYPGVQRFRPITWDEWFENFDGHDLCFVYEEEVADRAYELWEARHREPGRDREDWFEAEAQLRGPSSTALGRYRIVKRTREAPSTG